MSHIVEVKTKIVNPNLMLLREAMEIVAGAHKGGRVEDHIFDYSHIRRRLASKLALFTKKVTRGIGIEVADDGVMQFKGDDFRYESEYEQLQQEITQTYVSLATMKALEQMGYTSEASQVDQQVVIRGVTYA
jgi:hypothetical protein